MDTQPAKSIDWYSQWLKEIREPVRQSSYLAAVHICYFHNLDVTVGFLTVGKVVANVSAYLWYLFLLLGLLFRLDMIVCE